MPTKVVENSPWVRIERASKTEWGDTLITFVIKMPKFLVAQLNTHSNIRRNSASTRAIPLKTQLDRLEANLYIPPEIYKNQKGMSGSELLSPQDYDSLTTKLEEYYFNILDPFIEDLTRQYNAHKQPPGRDLEAFM